MHALCRTQDLPIAKSNEESKCEYVSTIGLQDLHSQLARSSEYSVLNGKAINLERFVHEIWLNFGTQCLI